MSKMKFLLDVPFFSELSPVELEPLTNLIIERKYKKGATIFLEGDSGDEFYIIKSGMVKIYRFDGIREVILDLFREGDYFGEMAVFQLKNKTRSASAETLEPTVLYALKRKEFLEVLESKPKLALKLLDISMNRLRKANEKIEDLTFLDARSRIIKTILDLSEDHGVSHPEGTLVNMKLTHQQLADMVGTVRETVTKVLLELQSHDYIHIEKKKILLREPLKLSALMPYALSRM